MRRRSGLIGTDLQRDLEALASRDLDALIRDDDRKELGAVGVIDTRRQSGGHNRRLCEERIRST